jgi:hypothetical protein
MKTRKILAMLGALVTGGVGIAMATSLIPSAAMAILGAITGGQGYAVCCNMTFMEN